MSLVLGVNLSHDRSACLIRDGKVVVAIEEERLDRIKHSEGFLVAGYFDRLTKTLPMKAITYCLRTAGVGLDDIDLVLGNRPASDQSELRLRRELPIRDHGRIRELPMPSHHLAHACACYFASPFDDAVILVVDGVGSRLPQSGRIEKHTIFVGTGTQVSSVLAATYSPDFTDVGLGLFYEYFTAKLGFVTRWGHPMFGSFSCGGYTEAGKTMGLAPYGEPREDWDRLLRIDGDDVSVTVAEMDAAWRRWYEKDGRGFDANEPHSWDTPFARDVARKVQDELEVAMLHLARRAYELTGKRRLCLTGGVALNSVANQRIVAEGPFDEIYILPPAGDAGVALGAAYYGYYELLGGTQRHHVRLAGLGRSYRQEEVLSAIKDCGAEVDYREGTPDDVAELLAGHYVVGWFDSGSEVGPRALGNRSILADPRHPAMRDYLNVVVKHREPFRPYAPSVLAEHAGEWFELAGESPFMLLVPRVREDRQSVVPAITHVDGTARVQTVTREDNPRYHQVIGAFAKRTRVPLVLNTSFNDAGEPIVETPADAVRTFLRTELDFLFLDGFLVSKPDRILSADHPRHSPIATTGSGRGGA
jgi:carbamoyltransferase